MIIDGPVAITVEENPDTASRTLHLTFTQAFQAGSLTQRQAEFTGYVNKLSKDSQQMADDAPDRAGMLAVLQIVEQLAPHIVADEIDLSEEIIIEIQPDNPLASVLGQARSLQ